ncbi:MAG: hypothetical protein K1X61_03235 [Chitinophagales bacterium]|nr:hypothetical protein [Chitinophagales bacterium]
MNLKDETDVNILLQNNTPLDDFLGLSPTDIHHLLYNTFSDNSPVHLRSDIDHTTLDRIPFFRIAEAFLKILQRDKFIKLTPLGALPRKPMVELYAHGFLPDEHIESGVVKLWKQQDCISIQTARFVCEIARLVKKSNGKLSLTKNGATLLQPENRLQLFKEILAAFTMGFNWDANDRYPQQPVGQLGWAFSVYMLNKFGSEARPVHFYADKYLTAFPMFITFFDTQSGASQQHFTLCYYIRTFSRFLLWFGFVTVKKEKAYSDADTNKYTATDLVQRVFTFE